ncbi:BON domain-containing protein [Grimontia hollisae]|uniref:Hemolysin n=2 Tax=Grimontia hollisae TaxID=673 RepID=D0I4Y7_GRIHO|nr:BON domain-containing protein [Grimontia hollisae]AMG30249.1 BON domain-containing protein [Grimontia hollisae]EEY73554.1 hemolysin precursor [Grimontia hollisae CIP 101886]MDF2183354.1 BON domain-containing protein [Grimontia hollisae]STO42394.1 outer membrane lipoprotein [Grimontia hollisae]STO56376.1 outer membrane lipoprotein [Grimontia hollisae]
MKKALLLTVLSGLSACSAIYEQDTRTAQTEWQDTQLEMAVAGIVNKAPFKGDARVNAVSYEGKLLLIGQAKTDSLKHALVTKVRELDDVKTVYDQIRIKTPLSVSDVSKDTWITTKVKSALIASKKLRNVNIKVITEDGEVFLLGYVTRTQADEATNIARNLSGVKQVIKGFQYYEPQ